MIDLLAFAAGLGLGAFLVYWRHRCYVAEALKLAAMDDHLIRQLDDQVELLEERIYKLHQELQS